MRIEVNERQLKRNEQSFLLTRIYIFTYASEIILEHILKIEATESSKKRSKKVHSPWASYFRRTSAHFDFSKVGTNLGANTEDRTKACWTKLGLLVKARGVNTNLEAYCQIHGKLVDMLFGFSMFQTLSEDRSRLYQRRFFAIKAVFFSVFRASHVFFFARASFAQIHISVIFQHLRTMFR